jgi:hypothetical protein
MQLLKQLSVLETQLSNRLGNFLLNRCEFGGRSGVKNRANTEPAEEYIPWACVETDGHRT